MAENRGIFKAMTPSKDDRKEGEDRALTGNAPDLTSEAESFDLSTTRLNILTKELRCHFSNLGEDIEGLILKEVLNSLRDEVKACHEFLRERIDDPKLFKRVKALFDFSAEGGVLAHRKADQAQILATIKAIDGAYRTRCRERGDSGREAAAIISYAHEMQHTDQLLEVLGTNGITAFLTEVSANICATRFGINARPDLTEGAASSKFRRRLYAPGERGLEARDSKLLQLFGLLASGYEKFERGSSYPIKDDPQRERRLNSHFLKFYNAKSWRELSRAFLSDIENREPLAKLFERAIALETKVAQKRAHFESAAYTTELLRAEEQGVKRSDFNSEKKEELKKLERQLLRDKKELLKGFISLSQEELASRGRYFIDNARMIPIVKKLEGLFVDADLLRKRSIVIQTKSADEATFVSDWLKSYLLEHEDSRMKALSITALKPESDQSIAERHRIIAGFRASEIDIVVAPEGFKADKLLGAADELYILGGDTLKAQKSFAEYRQKSKKAKPLLRVINFEIE